MKALTLNSTQMGSRNPEYAQVSLRFEWLVVLSSLWLFTGLYLDGWAHNNIADPALTHPKLSWLPRDSSSRRTSHMRS